MRSNIAELGEKERLGVTDQNSKVFDYFCQPLRIIFSHRLVLQILIVSLVGVIETDHKRLRRLVRTEKF